MSNAYDTYYQNPDLFGKPCPELIAFFKGIPEHGRLLDVGCGQGRDAIPLARMGFKVTGIDTSNVGIKQMQEIANTEALTLTAEVADIYTYKHYTDFDIIFMDSMFHFTKKGKQVETDLIRHIISEAKPGCIVVFCNQDTGDKIKVLKETLDQTEKSEYIHEEALKYTYHDAESNHASITDYKLIAVRK